MYYSFAARLTHPTIIGKMRIAVRILNKLDNQEKPAAINASVKEIAKLGFEDNKVKAG